MVKNFNVRYWSGSIDFNGVIHTCLDEIKENIEEYEDEDIENILIEKVLVKLKKISIELRIDDTLLICTDGLVPQAKMNDQRCRRYNFKEKRIEVIGDFYRSAITPRTNFMKKLDKRMKISLKDDPLAPNVIYSNDEILGEGEGKIVSHFREWSNTKNEENHVIYGLDADLIVLCLCSPLKNIFIKREDKKEYLNIDMLRKELIKEFSHGKNRRKDIINDFVILTFFLGNDFVKKIPYFSDLRFGIDFLTEIYKENEICLTRDGVINYEKGLKKLFRVLRNEESNLLRRASKAKFNKYEYYGGIDRFSKQWYDRCFLPRKPEKLKELGIKIIYDEDTIRSMVEKYVEIIYWVFRYYTKGINKINFNYSYLYYYSPLLYELYKYSQESDEQINLYKEKTDIPSIASQLLYVLPPQISDIIDPKIASFYENIKTYFMFPVRGYMDKDYNTETEIIYIFSIIDKLDGIVRKKIGDKYNHKNDEEELSFKSKFGILKEHKKRTAFVKTGTGYTRYYDRRRE